MSVNSNRPIREAMASGAWFHPVHPDLIADSERAEAVMRQFNNDPNLDDFGRMDLLRSLFASMGDNSFIRGSVSFDYGYNISIGNDCFFNFNCTFLDGAPITFGDRVMAGPGCMFLTPLHPMVASQRFETFEDGSRPLEWEREAPITVGSDVWFGAGTIVNPGVSVGSGCVIGSGSVVTRDIPANVFAAGNPCRVIREITEADAVTSLQAPVQ